LNEKQIAINFRPMTRSDTRAVLTLDRKFNKSGSRLSDKDMAATEPGGPLDLSFVAEDEGKMVGFLIARIGYYMIPFVEVCIIQGVLIDPEYQSRGIGSKLLTELLDYCQNEGINTVRALVEEHDTDLRRFFERLGFQSSTILNYDKTFES
jgi:ribosomal protein S18 acetylase RimI-like enzyme